MPISGNWTRRNRRQFLTYAGAASASTLLPVFKAWGFDEKERPIQQVTTSDTGKHQPSSGSAWKQAPASGPPIAETIQLDPAQTYQQMLGFGCAYTDASCFLLSGMRADVRNKFLDDTFSPRHMNLNVGRVSIGASDYSRDVYNYDDVAGDTGMAHFSIAHDESYILPMLRRMRELNPELFLLATPWSPPGWMKVYGSMLGGWMSRKYLQPYALYFTRFLEAYRAAGVPIDAVTSQNEVETDQSGHMPATYWTPEMELDFVRDHLGPMLKSSGDRTQIWLLDHNYELWKRVRWQMQDQELRKFVSGVAWHGYVGTPDQMSSLHAVEPDLPFFWTEGGPDYTDPRYAYEWTRWGTIFSAAIRNWCRCLITWNLMLNERGEPNIGPFSCGGLVTLRGDSDLQYSGQYWALRHFSQHVRRGATRIASHSDASELSHVAFQNPDGSRVLIVTNTGDDRQVALASGNLVAKVAIEKNSMSTFTW